MSKTASTYTGLRILGLRFHQPIFTGQLHTPWLSVFMLSLVWFTFGFNIFAGGQALTFTIQQFTDDPRHIALITSVGALLVLGPFISYLSDQIWTPFGRRKPFIVIAWLGSAVAMYGFAFIRPILASLNGALGMVNLPAVGAIFFLLIIVIGYQKLQDLAAPLEPLFMETVSPHQRGRFFAIRGILFTLAIMLFYQVLWPFYDKMIDMSSWLGFPGAVVLKGEQVIYLLAASLYTITGLFLIICIKEAPIPTAPNHRLRDMFFNDIKVKSAESADSLLAVGGNNAVMRFIRANAPARLVALPFFWFFTRTPFGTFVTNFCRDVFLRRENIPFYLILVIPGIEGIVWGGFNALMQNDQFGYSKANQALWAFPIQIIQMVAIAPFAGWYSDIRLNVRWWLRILLLVIAVGGGIAIFIMYQQFAPENIRDLPPLWAITALSIVASASALCLIIPILETVLDKVGREHARAWIALLTVFKSMILICLQYIWIRNSPDHIPSITSWMLFGVVGMSLSGLIDAFLAPMIYDYIPRSKMGTVFAGSNFFGRIVTFPMAALGGWWIVWYSTNVGHPAHCKYDYTSLYPLQMLCFIPVIAVKVYFLWLILKNKLPKAGIIEVEEGAKAEEVALAKAEAEEKALVKGETLPVD